jgi:hypothetical protein
MFTTLYRDNYERRSGCAGEGCGKHPGVDIAVVSGTPVVSSTNGIVYRAENCNLGWGGLVVVETAHPYKPEEKVYIGYAHLRKIFIPEKFDGQTSSVTPITQGQIIGESGGALTDLCHGWSTGSHLHFQVDRPHVGSYPWYPSKTATVEKPVEVADTDFEVGKYTHNPLPFVLGYAYHYTFSEDNNREWWGAANGNSYNTANSDLWFDSSSTKPYLGRSSIFGDVAGCGAVDYLGKVVPCSRQITLDASVFKKLILRLNFECYNNPVTVYFRGPDYLWRGGSFNYSGAWTYTINMSSLSSWTGIMTDIVIQPSRGCTANPGPVEYYIQQMYFLTG